MSDKPVQIYTTNYCPYCVSAKRMLTELGVGFDEINLESKPDLRLKLSQDNGGWRTVPMIFVKGEFVGGYDDLRAMHQRGELMSKLSQA